MTLTTSSPFGRRPPLWTSARGTAREQRDARGRPEVR
jgi:hypothetical protein